MFITIFFFIVNRIFFKQKLHCINFDNHINGSMYQSIFDYNKLDNVTHHNSSFTMVQEFDYYNITHHALKYGAYTNHLPNTNYIQKKKRKKNNKNKSKNEQKYINKFIDKINKNKNINKDDKPLVFLVSPNQLHYYKVYNKTINKNKNNNFFNATNNNNNTKLSDDFDDDDYYIWF